MFSVSFILNISLCIKIKIYKIEVCLNFKIMFACVSESPYIAKTRVPGYYYKLSKVFNFRL